MEEPASDPDDGMTAAAELIADIPTTQAFTDDEVPDEDIDKILSAGINAPQRHERAELALHRRDR